MGARGVRRGRPVVARLCLDAFPGARRWQNARAVRPPSARRRRDCALMRSWPDWQWQYTRAVRSRGSCRGKIPPRCVPGRQSVAGFAPHASRKRPRAGKSPLPGKIRAPCIRNELALARYARHASEKPRKSPLEDTPREDLARKGHFSLHGPLESCTARESCHPASTKHPSARNPCATDQRRTARAPATPAPPNSASRPQPRRRPHGSAHPQHSRCQRQPHRKRSHTPPPRDTEASGGREILRRPSPAAPKRSSGPTAPQHPTAPPGRSIYNGGGANQARCGP